MTNSLPPSRRAAFGECDLAGVLEAFDALAPADEEAAGAIAGMLGFSFLARDVETSATQSSVQIPVSARLQKLPAPAAHRRESRGPIVVEPHLLERRESTSLLDDADVAATEPLARTERAHAQPPEHVPLIAPRWSRGVFGELLATMDLTGELDWPAIERAALTGEPLVSLPLGRERGLRRGVDLWMDVSESMQPFARDQAQLVRLLRRLLGRHAVRVRHFEVDDLAQSEPLDWSGSAPLDVAAGRCVLVVSDFGVGRAIERSPPATLAALNPWFERARDRGCRLVGLIPAPSDAWPAGVTQSLLGFEWDRALSAPAVRARTRASLGQS